MVKLDNLGKKKLIILGLILYIWEYKEKFVFSFKLICKIGNLLKNFDLKFVSLFNLTGKINCFVLFILKLLS